MARDSVARPIQGPDNGSGNPVLVTPSGLGTQAVRGDGCDAIGSQAAVNTANVISVTGVANQRVRVQSITANYLGANAAANLSVSDGVTTLFFTVMPAPANTPLHFPFPDGGLRAAVGATVTITLAAGGAGTNANLSASWKIW